MMIDSDRKILPDCVVGFSMGMRHAAPGASNEALGRELMMYLYQKPVIPLLLQHEIASCVNVYHTDVPQIHKARVIETHRIKGEYLDTREVGIQAWEEMEKRGWKSCGILAHKDHAVRCAAVMRRLGAVVTGFITTDIYDHLSAQGWTKYRFLFVPYNALAMYMFRRRGWV